MSGRKKTLAEALRDAALEYADLGFYVFPLRPQGKKPLPGSHGLLDATTDPETICQWWEDHPEANIGVDCGRSGLVVLDVDCKNGKDARPAVEGKDLAGAVTVATPTEKQLGRHYYWKANGAKFQSGADLYGFDGLDVRADGAYAVLPPSCIITEQGEQARPYRKLSGDFSKIGNVPQWLVELERKRQAEKTIPATAAAPGGGEVVPQEADEQTIERARAYLVKMPEAIEHDKGHVKLLKAATALVIGFRLSDADALAILREDYNPRCVPPWTEKELKHKITEARANKLGKTPGYLLSHGLPLANYVTETRTGKDGKPNVLHVPRKLNDIVADVLERFDGYPKRLGERLFYLDTEANAVRELATPDALSAWVQRCGGCGIDFLTGHGFVKVRELYEALLQTTERFDAVSSAPFYPDRANVFSLCGKLPEPTKDASAFWKLLDFMCPATAEDRLLMAAFFVAPMCFAPGGDFDRPGWCIDTEDAQASGKTSVAEVNARTHDCIPLSLDFSTLDRSQEAVKKRLISSEGRATRFALFDNVRSATIKSPVLANLVTAKYITERAAYGRGEESRPNDLTWTITVNGGTFDTDLATRFYPVVIVEPEASTAFWKRRVFSYIDEHRPQILADIRGLIERALARVENGEVWTRRKSRFPEFDAAVLAAVCQTKEEFDAVDRRISSHMAESNDDADRAARFEAAFLRELKTNAPMLVDDLPVVVFASDIDAMISTSDELQRLRFTSRDVRAWIKSGLMPSWSKEFRKINNAKSYGSDMGASAFLYGLEKFVASSGAVQVAKRVRNVDTRQVEWRLSAQITMRKTP